MRIAAVRCRRRPLVYCADKRISELAHPSGPTTYRRVLAVFTGTEPEPAYGVGVGPMSDAAEVTADADLAAALRRCRDDMLAALRNPRY